MNPYVQARTHALTTFVRLQVWEALYLTRKTSGSEYIAISPLYRYILWTEENVPKGGRDIGTLLERCIKEFQDVAKYENDERYLNVWLKYVSGGHT